ncbi:tryptophanase [Hyphobacterium sp. CCMP332]|nr:tryptophanase [Hyphobacterium sp. CCMP332]
MEGFNTIFEPFKIKTVESIKLTSREERIKYLKEAYYNPFLLESDKVIIDLLTDSGTSAMSSEQWAGMMRGDESYAGARSWIRMRDTILDLSGYKHILPTHQGRAAERILYGYLGGKGKIFISNTLFDTTRANIEFSGAEGIDIPISENSQPSLYHPFKGNMDIAGLENLIKEKSPENIGAVVLTVTNNSGGGQPVSMENTRAISEICKKYAVKFFLDSCRIAENSYFIKKREKEFENVSYKEIAREMFSLADGTIMSAKKDGLVNMGGFLAFNDDELNEKLQNLLIITEGFTTYGGLSGRDMEAIATGLNEVFEHDYLHYRIRSIAYLGDRLKKMGVPIMEPTGGHAVYIDAKALYPQIPLDHYPGQALVCELYVEGGIRAVEIGSVMFGKYNKRHELIPASMELVRLAIPRRVYTQSHMDFVIEVFEKIMQKREKTTGLKIVYEQPFLRHFTAHFEHS